MAVDVVNTEKRVGVERGYAMDGVVFLVLAFLILFAAWEFSYDEGFFTGLTEHERPHPLLVLARTAYVFHGVALVVVAIAILLFTTSRSLVFHKDEGVLVYSSSVFFSSFGKRWKREEVARLVAVKRREKESHVSRDGYSSESTREKGYLRAQMVDGRVEELMDMPEYLDLIQAGRSIAEAMGVDFEDVISSSEKSTTSTFARRGF